MKTTETNEQAFEWLIEKALVGTTKEERQATGQTDVDAQQPDESHYYWGLPKDMDKKLALDLRRLWSFLETTQGDELKEYKGKDIRTELPRLLSKEIETFGIIQVLREKFEIGNIKLSLFYPKPTAADSKASHQKYKQNQFSLTRQQTYAILKPGDELDMVLYVNGIPLFTFELKNPWTYQTARKNGQEQYKKDRNPKETLLQYGRCLAHFTMDKDEVFFTTRLCGDKTYFMPFNKGLPNGQGAGNPVNQEGGYKTSYMWEHVLQKDTVADIIMNYVLFDYDEAKAKKKVPHIMKNAKKLIFPRYHQLDVVTKLEEDVAKVGVGKTYLIQHSAGSGKSNSLTWLAYKLIATCPETMDAVRATSLDTPLFNSVIVVTDRKLLDRQITDNIRAFGKSAKTVAHADCADSKDRMPKTGLKQHIEDGKRIIITTIQKFPFMCDTISNMSDRNFAVIIDEAHSSQSGIAADKLNASLQKDDDTDGADTDALLEKLMKDRKMSSNCSYFAFTATPKKETRERFGSEDSEGKFHPFHLYSMKQAIEEGFILNVLTNYTTYRSYYELTKSIEENPEYNNERAQKMLRCYVERDPKTIEAKAEVMLTHFDAKVFRNHKLKGKAKAMVVTKDIECAIMYYHALQDLIRDKKLPYKVLIAFSGTKTIKGRDYTEAGLNGFPENETAEMFENDDYRLLVVANKYLTGFDQPKLCAMYIDKPLAGVQAVQALSRLNRSAYDLGKLSEDLFILDFYNTTEEMKAAFDPFYTASTLSEATDVNVLHQLKTTLLSLGVFDMDEVNDFIELYLHGVEADQWAPIIDTAAERFNKEIDWPENGKADFKMKCKQFVKIYSRVAAIMDYEVADWEKLFWFLRYLIPQLVVPGKSADDIKDLFDSVDLNTYGLRRTALNETIELDAAEAVVDPNKPVMVNAGADEEDPKDPLDEILKEFNERWFKGWQATPDDQKAKLLSMAKAVAEDEDYKTMVVGNPDQQAVEEIYAKIIDSIVRKKRKGDMSLYKEYQQNEGFKVNFQNLLIRMVENMEYTADITRDNHSSAKVIPLYTEYHDGCVPLYTLRVACGKHEDGVLPEVEKWVDVTGNGFSPDPKRYFAVYAMGNSMLPKIQDGNICVFEWYNDRAGSRDGDIVLSMINEHDNDFGGPYTIKKYHSEKTPTEEGWQHTKIELIPLNKDYEVIKLNDATDYRTVGVLKCVLNK